MVASRKFCCCLPVRIAVFVLSGLTAVLGGVSAAAIWYTIARATRDGLADKSSITIVPGDNPTSYKDTVDSIRLDKTQYIAFIVAGSLLTIFSLFSVFGFIGAVIRKRSFVSIYSKALWIFFGLSIVSGAFFLYAIFKNRSDAAADCTAQTSEQKACNVASKFVVGLYVASFVVQWLIHLYCCIVVKRYVEQLEDEQAYIHRGSGNKVNLTAGNASSYYAHEPLVGGKHEHELPLYNPSVTSIHKH